MKGIMGEIREKPDAPTAAGDKSPSIYLQCLLAADFSYSPITSNGKARLRDLRDSTRVQQELREHIRSF
jgi:hypothetical protein